MVKFASTEKTGFVKRIKEAVLVLQNALIICILVFFGWDSTTQNYTSFTEAPPNVADKIWYCGEAFLFLLMGITFVAINKGFVKLGWDYVDRYIVAWFCLTIFFTFRLIWVITWITFGLSANMNLAQAILFSIILVSAIFITFLPYLEKIFKGIK